MKKLILIVFLTFFSNLVLAENRIETIQLNHRLATEVLPEVQAFLPPQAVARAFNDLIILQADSQTIGKIKQLIRQIDMPLQRLKISVRRTQQLLSNQDGSSISGGVVIHNNNVSTNVAISKWSAENSQNTNQHFYAQGIEGNPISVMLGEAIPQKNQYLILHSYGEISFRDTTHYINVSNGFNAIARILTNHQVVVDIHPQFGKFSRQTGRVETSEVLTSLRGNEGEWILLGETNTGENIDQYGSTSYHSNKEQKEYIYIKIDKLL